jgi:hypothetical protein
MTEASLARFDYASFERAAEGDLSELMEALAAQLRARLVAATDFHQAVEEAISALRAQGHNFFSFDEDDDFEIWCPDYTARLRPTCGLILTFRAPSSVDVAWKADGSAASNT